MSTPPLPNILTTGRTAPWDHAPTIDAADSYWRNYNDGRPDPDRVLRWPRPPKAPS